MHDLLRGAISWLLRIVLLSAPLFAQSTPTITSLSQTSGAVGAPITITGTNFGGTQGTSTVTFNGTVAAANNWNTTTITVLVPSGATNGNVVVHVGGLDSNGVSFTVIGPVGYVYDDLGRLTAVIDGYGNAATYNYDAVGNILSINQVSSSQVSIIQFTPARGPVGTAVTIYGTGFSAIASQNSVSFNGTAATVSSATSTTLQVTVPSGAGSGTIGVTSPAGSATSAAAFTVTADSGAPTITSFTPQNGVAGNSVSIVGTNFDPVLSNNKLRVNASSAIANSVTSTTGITGTIPSATASGHISVITPVGKAVSTQDLYIPFGSHVASDIGFTGRITSGNSQTVTLATSKIGMLLFDAVAGQQVSIQMSGSTFSTCTLYLVAPDNTTVTSKACTSGNSNLGSTYLPKPGTYAIGVDPGTAAGSITLTLTSDIVGTIVPGGPPVTVTTTQPGQNARLTFTAVANQRVSMNISNSTYQYCTITLYQPNGDSVSSSVCNTSTFWDIPNLPIGGVYTFVVAPTNNTTGHVTLQLNDASDFTAPITIDGSAVTATTTVLGQDARLSFSATSGQRIVVYATSVSNPSAYLYLVKPDGTNQTYISIANTPSGQTFFIDTQTLATTGTYQLWVKHVTTNIGSETLRLASVPPDFSGTLTVPAAGQTGPPVRVPTSGNLAVGQNGTLTFNGTSGQRLSFNVLSPTFASCNLTIYDPNGTQIYSGNNCTTGASGYIDTLTLAATGTFSIVINPIGTATGSVSVSINNDSDVTGTIAIDGSPVTVTTTAAGQDVRLSFSATSGQRIVVYATSVSNPSAYLYLVKPDGTNQTYISIANTPSGQTFFIDTQTLATTGTYQLWVKHYGANIGSETLRIASVPADFSSTITVPAAGQTGPAVRVPTTGNLSPGQNGTLTFSGTSGQKLSFNVLSPTFSSSSCILRIYDPSGGQLYGGNNCSSGSSGYIDTLTLAATGTFSIVIDPTGAATGSVSVSINNAGDATGTITIDGSSVTVTTTVAGQDARLSLGATSGQRIVVYATSVSNPSAYLYLVKPDGTNQTYVTISNVPSGQTFFIDTQTLATTGTYQLWVKHSGANLGSETLRVASVAADVSGSVTIGGAAFTVNTVAGQNANITFNNPQSQSVTVHWSSGTYPSTLGCSMRVTGPSPSQTQVGYATCNTVTGTLSLGTQTAGTYNILVDPQQQSTGGLSLTVTTP